METFEIGALITLIITNIVSPIISWMLAKKRYNVEVDSSVIANMKESLAFFKDICESNREEMAKLRGEYAEYKEAKEREASIMRAELRDLKSQQLAMFQLMCMDLPCQYRQPYLSKGGKVPSDLFKNAIEKLHSYQRENEEPSEDEVNEEEKDEK